MSLVRHIPFTIHTLNNAEKVQEPQKFPTLFKHQYPLSYNLSSKLIELIHHTFKKQLFDPQAVYLTMHLQSLHKKLK
ncbi:PRD domain-containing protein [Cytobacillus oceanisediminis]|uniref:PRD domain-containing protein n=1 Tax=Cytobacillus oceanisediminis TaxID=665099 RepID=UPI0037C0B0CE